VSLSACVADPNAFVEERWLRRPVLDGGAPQRFSALLDEAEVEELVACRGLRLPAFRMVRNGTLLATGLYTRSVPLGQGEVGDLLDPDGVVRLFEDGATLILRGLERYHPAIGAFCAALAGDLGHPVRANSYVTPANAQGHGIHFDLHDVFVLQCSGRKHWKVYDRHVADPLPGHVEPYVRSEDLGATVVDEVLGPGDTLYIPRGWPHVASTTGDASIHLTLGVHVLTWLDVLAAVLERARGCAQLRAALPLGDEAGFEAGFSAAAETLAALLEQHSPAELHELMRATAEARQGLPAAAEWVPRSPARGDRSA
jgi:lysine-specific demethylase/histidyl-hydroxylase NO66